MEPAGTQKTVTSLAQGPLLEWRSQEPHPNSVLFLPHCPAEEKEPGEKPLLPGTHQTPRGCEGRLTLGLLTWESGKELVTGSNCQWGTEPSQWALSGTQSQSKALNALHSRTHSRHPQSFHKHFLNCTFSFNEARIFIHLLGFVNVKIRSIITPI